MDFCDCQVIIYYRSKVYNYLAKTFFADSKSVIKFGLGSFPYETDAYKRFNRRRPFFENYLLII